MRTVLLIVVGVAMVFGWSLFSKASEESVQPQTPEPTAEGEWPAALNFTMKTLSGEEVHLGEKYAGKVVLFVNVASRCGFTGQYEGLQALHEKYSEKGLAIVGVPCNQFAGQEPGTADQIAQFCETRYGVEFDMLEKVNVRGKEQCPLYAYLTNEKKLPGIGSSVKWNFEKFLIGRDGTPIAHYKSKVKPQSDTMIEAIEKALAEKP